MDLLHDAVEYIRDYQRKNPRATLSDAYADFLAGRNLDPIKYDWIGGSIDSVSYFDAVEQRQRV